MNPVWQEFLAMQHAHVQDGIVQNFGDAQGELAAARDGTVLCDLSQFGTLKVSGADAQGFLQNLLSNDLKAVTPAQAQLNSFNSAKGRMLASFLVWQSSGDYFLQLPRALCAAMQKKLSMYVLRSKVKIEDVSALQVSLGLSGQNAAKLLREEVGPVPQDIFAVQQYAHFDIQQKHFSVIRSGAERFEIITMPQHAPALWQKLCAGARPAGSTCWDWLNIRAGIPAILPATQEQFVPQMANFDLIGGVSFKKGCYPGQEIVARMQYLGKLKRRMYLAHIAGGAQAGDELYSAEMEGQSCGMVANAAPAPGGGHDVLAVVQISSHDAHTVHLGSLQGEALQFMPLPYALPETAATTAS
jgi:folate-binding protein YgfZ